MTQKILIFGGTGFIGRNLCRFLAQNDYQIKSFDNNERGHNLVSYDNDIEYLTGDICNYEDVKNAIKGSDIVLNLAYINGTKNFYSIPGRILEIAAMGQLNVGNAINDLGVKKFIYASSSEAYQTPGLFPTLESESLKVPDPFNPRYSYGGGKIFGELCTLHHVKNVDNKIIFRPHNIYGPMMGDDHVIPELFTKIKSSISKGLDTLDVIGSKNTTRSFMYIDDAVKAIKLLIENVDNNEIINIGSGIETTISELVEMMISTSGFKLRPVYNVEGHEGGVSRRLPDITKLKTLGYENHVDLKSGLMAFWKSIINKNEL